MTGKAVLSVAAGWYSGILSRDGKDFYKCRILINRLPAAGADGMRRDAMKMSVMDWRTNLHGSSSHFMMVKIKFKGIFGNIDLDNLSPLILNVVTIFVVVKSSQKGFLQEWLRKCFGKHVTWYINYFYNFYKHHHSKRTSSRCANIT